jgi:hypothetical protein
MQVNQQVLPWGEKELTNTILHTVFMVVNSPAATFSVYDSNPPVSCTRCDVRGGLILLQCLPSFVNRLISAYAVHDEQPDPTYLPRRPTDWLLLPPPSRMASPTVPRTPGHAAARFVKRGGAAAAMTVDSSRRQRHPVG